MCEVVEVQEPNETKRPCASCEGGACRLRFSPGSDWIDCVVRTTQRSTSQSFYPHRTRDQEPENSRVSPALPEVNTTRQPPNDGNSSAAAFDEGVSHAASFHRTGIA